MDLDKGIFRIGLVKGIYCLTAYLITGDESKLGGEGQIRAFNVSAGALVVTTISLLLSVAINIHSIVTDKHVDNEARETAMMASNAFTNLAPRVNQLENGLMVTSQSGEARVTILETEVTSLRRDSDAYKERIRELEGELADIRTELDAIKPKLENP